MNNTKLSYDDIQKSIKSIVNECYDISENKFPILKSIKKIEIDNYKSFDELRIVMFNHALKYDCELQEIFLLKLNELFSNSDFKFKSLSDEAKEMCKSSKWNDKSDNYKFTPYFLSDCKINMFIQKEAYEDNSIIYRNINKVILNTYSYGVISDFTTFFILVYKYGIDPININIAIDSEFEKWLYELFGAKSENIDLINDWNKNENFKKIMGKKHFDVTFGNPPYTKNTDLTILKLIKKISDTCIFIHPASFLISNKKRKTDIYSSLIECGNLKKLLLFWGNEIFNIGLFLPLCISYWDKNYNSNYVNVMDKAISVNENYKIDINDISVYGKHIEVKHFIEKFHEKYNDNFRNHYLSYGDIPGKYSVKFSIVRGHSHAQNGWCDDFFSFICQTNKQIEKSNFCDETFKWQDLKKTHGMMNAVFSFNTENERNNFIRYCKTKFARFFLSYIKYNGNLFDSDKYVPWLDFTQEWNDAKLCKEFGISEELWNYIDNFIPDYYDDYKSGFEK